MRPDDFPLLTNKIERHLRVLNELVAPIQKQLEQVSADSPKHKTVFILGPPRGGTTLCSQLVAASDLFGISNNIVSRFWNAPALGVMISEILRQQGVSVPNRYKSERGITDGWNEPSEFGYFWSRFFDLGQSTHKLSKEERLRVHIEGLQRAIASMEQVWGRPMAFKNNTWFTFQADMLAEAFPGCILVACRRDPFFIAQSLYRQRLLLYGDPTRWWSVRPPDYQEIRELPPIKQVAMQAVSICVEMERTLARTRGAIIINAAYSRLVQQPRDVLAEIAIATGFSKDQVHLAKDKAPASFASTDIVTLDGRAAQEMESAVRDAEKYYGTT